MVDFSVPYRRQLEKYDCAVASMGMFLGACGIHANRDELFSLLRPDPQTGTPRERIIEVADHYGLSVQSKLMRFEDFQIAQEQAERTALINYRCEGEGHYGVVIGQELSRKEVRVHDPYLGPALAISEQDLMKLWLGHDAPKGYGWCLIPEIRQDISNVITEVEESIHPSERFHSSRMRRSSRESFVGISTVTVT